MTIPTIGDQQRDGPAPAGPFSVPAVEPLPKIGGMATRVSSPILIGREAELRTLIVAWDAAAAGRPSTVLIGGEAGIGKSRLVAELTRHAWASGGVVLEGASISLGSDEGLPLAPIADALRALARLLPPDELREVVGSASPALGRLVPELGATVDINDAGARPDWVQARMLEAVHGVLQRLGDRQPVLLVVEDLHWADRSTRDVLSFIARTARAERLLVVGTYRTDEIHRRHPIRPWLAEMERTPRVSRLALERLAAGPLADLVEAIRAVPPDQALLRTIADRSEGNPFYVEELLAAGALQPRDRLPSDLRDVLLSRVAALPDEIQNLLGVAAVAGRSVEHEPLREVAALDDERLEAAMREAMAAGIVVATTEGQTALYAFRHALLQEAVYEDLLPTERRRHHASYATALRERPVSDGAVGAGRLAAIAHHASASHDLVGALAAWIAAGRASARAYAFATAARDLERALDLWDAVSADDRPTDLDQIQVHHELALARWNAGELSGAVDAGRRAVELSRPGADLIRTAILVERLGRIAWGAGEFEDALRYHAESVTLLDGQPPSPTLARALSGYGAVLMLRGHHRESIEVCRHAITVARAVGAEVEESSAMNSLGVCLAQLGDCPQAVDLMREVFERTPALNDTFEMGRAYGNYAAVLQICGRLEESAEISGAGSDWARQNGVWQTFGLFHLGNRASALIELGRWREARDLLARAAEDEPQGVTALNLASNAGPLAVRMGDLELARSVLRGAADRAKTAGDAQFTAPISAGIVELELAEGRLDDAWATATDGLRTVAQTDDALLLTFLTAVAARVAADRALAAAAAHRETERQAAIADARRLADDVAARIASIDRASPAAAEPIGNLALAKAEATRAAGEPGVDAWVGAADHWAGLGRPWNTAYSRYRQGEALLETGARSEATPVLAEARATAETLGAAPLRDEIDGLARRARLTLEGPAPAGLEAAEPVVSAVEAPATDPFGLTSREREVLTLVAAGHTNRRIADALFISESTAGVHVSNILGKLGVTSRTEAAAVAVRLGLAD
jgi:DNA-binding CsgD family transcriptional regulator/tetratricopeptide (TPR) repeat protein